MCACKITITVSRALSNAEPHISSIHALSTQYVLGYINSAPLLLSAFQLVFKRICGNKWVVIENVLKVCAQYQN